MARPERFELPTTKFVAWYSIQLSYGRVFKLLPCRLTILVESAEARSGIIQIRGRCVNTFFHIFFIAVEESSCPAVKALHLSRIV
jgi:hypothetical protein